MTFDLPTASIALGACTLTWYLLRLTVFDAIKELRDSNIRQGKRLGELEEWQVAHDKVEDYKYKRRMTAPSGVPKADEDSDPGERK